MPFGTRAETWECASPAAEVSGDPSYDKINLPTFQGLLGRPRDGLYEPALADTEREAVADLLQYLENVRAIPGRYGTSPECWP